MGYQQAADAAIGYVRDGEQGNLPPDLTGLDEQGHNQVLDAARRHVRGDAKQIVDAVVDRRAADNLASGSDR